MPDYIKENDTDFKWYVVHISQPGKELELKKLLQKSLGKIGNIIEFYCPIQTPDRNFNKYDDGRRGIPTRIKVRGKNGKSKAKIQRVLPLFAGMVFVKATQTALASFLSDYFPIGTIMYSKPISTKPAPIVIKDDKMKALKDFNDNLPAEPVLLQKPFKDYSFNEIKNEPNETIMVIGGILAGRTGYLIRINGNRGLAFQMEDPVGNGFITVGIPNIRYFHIVRIHNSGVDPTTFATRKQRAVDLLIGLIQGAGYTDNRVLGILYDIVDYLRRESSFTKCAEYIKQRKYNYKDKELTEKTKKSNEALSESLKSLSPEAQRLILYLIWYENENPGYVFNTYRSLIIRPFLTPTSGIMPLDEKSYGVLHHNGFLEIIKPVEISEKTFIPKDPGNKVQAEATTYYAHIGIKAQDKKFIIFANWDGILSKYFATEGKANEKVLNGRIIVTYKTDKHGNILKDKESKKPIIKDDKTIESFYNYAKPLYDVLVGNSDVKAVKDFVIRESEKGIKTTLNVMCIEAKKTVSKAEVLDSPEVGKAINKLTDTCIDICKTLNSETHIKMWREYLNTVWLHK